MEYSESPGPLGDAELKHSGFGVASFVIGLAVGLIEFVLFAVAGFMEISTPGGIDEESPAVILLGLAVIGGILVALLGAVLAIAGLCQARRARMFAIIGLLINAAVFVGVIFLILVGLLLE